jgi:hypothetical protein
VACAILDGKGAGMHHTDTIQVEAEAVATAATRQAVRAALQDYWTAVAAWEEARQAAASTGMEVVTAQHQAWAAWQALHTCWQLHYGRPLSGP